MTITPDELADARALQAETMIDTGRIERPGAGGLVWDPATETMTPEAPEVIYTGPLRCALVNEAMQPEIVDTPVTIAPFVITVPHTVVVPADARVVITSSGDPALLGEYDVVTVAGSTYVTARRLFCRRRL